MPDIRFPGVILTVGGDYKPGDPAPTGYTDWHEWAEVQHKAGLRQAQCGRCGLWRYPQELSEKEDEMKARDRYGKHVVVRTPVCAACMANASN